MLRNIKKMPRNVEQKIMQKMQKFKRTSTTNKKIKAREEKHVEIL